MPKKSITFSTEDMVLWHRVTSQVTPLKSNTVALSLQTWVLMPLNAKTSFSKNNARTQKRMALDNAPVSAC